MVSQPDGVKGPDCVLSSQFTHGQGVVFRERVLDQTGKPMTDSDLKSLTVVLSSGQTISMRYGGHPHTNPEDSFWSGSWKIAADYPSGSLSYKVVATTEDGSTQSWTPFNVKLSELTVLPGSAGDAE